MSALLQVSDLRLRLPGEGGLAAVLQGVSFSLARGEALGLIGESGSGKSMTALALMGLLPAGAELSGSIRFQGQELIGLNDEAMCGLRGRRIGMVSQEPMTALNPLHTVGRQIAEPLRLHLGWSARQARAEALRLLERVRMPQAAQRLDAYPHQLSGGQRQRVMMASALACRPELLIADEPTTALDASVQREILDLIGDLTRESGMGLLLISHDLAAMAMRVSSVLVMHGGRVVESGDSHQVFTSPVHPYTQGLLAARPSISRPRGTRLSTTPSQVAEPRLCL